MKKIICTLDELRAKGQKRGLICFGGGNFLLNNLFGESTENCGFETIVDFIIDNDSNKDGSCFNVRGKSIPIYSWENAKNRIDRNAIIVVSSRFHNEEIEKQLCEAYADSSQEYCILRNTINYYHEDERLKNILLENKKLKNRIPKKLHWCWFGRNDLPDLQKKCLESWKEKCPDYEIIKWDEDSFDLDSNIFAREAYESKKYAFVADYVRLWCIYEFGGIYVDSDVEIIKNLDAFLCHSAFSGFEDRIYIPTGIMGGEKGNFWFKYLLSYYDNRHFITDKGLDTTTNCKIISRMTFDKIGKKLRNGYYDLSDVTIYPQEVFCPLDWDTKEVNLTSNTYCIHWFSGSWTKV